MPPVPFDVSLNPDVNVRRSSVAELALTVAASDLLL